MSDWPIDCLHDRRCSERLIRSMADVMSLPSFQRAGFKYIIVDDCWMDRNRDSSGKLQADVRRFPSGIQDLISYVCLLFIAPLYVASKGSSDLLDSTHSVEKKLFSVLQECRINCAHNSHPMGAVRKVGHAIFDHFEPPPLSQTVTDLGYPKKYVTKLAP